MSFGTVHLQHGAPEGGHCRRERGRPPPPIDSPWGRRYARRASTPATFTLQMSTGDGQIQAQGQLDLFRWVRVEDRPPQPVVNASPPPAPARWSGRLDGGFSLAALEQARFTGLPEVLSGLGDEALRRELAKFAGEDVAAAVIEDLAAEQPQGQKGGALSRLGKKINNLFPGKND